jgi:uncharacterized protein
MPIKKFANPFKNSLILCIKGYQYFLGPLLCPQCRYEPTCSFYAIEALQKKSTLQAFKLIIFRVCSCHPLGGQGYDPVP